MANFRKFIESVKIGNIESAKSNYNIEFFTKNQDGLMPIHWACITYQLEILKWILDNKCDVNLPTKKGWRPIHFAVFMSNGKMVELLIENYCDLECITNKGKTVLDIANGNCSRSYLETILQRKNKLRIALYMGLKCSPDCDHKFCLNSMMKCKFGKDKVIARTENTQMLRFQDSNSNRKFAVLEIRNYYNRDTKLTFILKKINRFQSKIDHENIIKYYGMIVMRSKWKIFMEWNDKGSMEDVIESDGPLSEGEIARYCKDLLRAVAFLHQNKIIHRDINPSNILIDNNGGCKLIISIHSTILVSMDGEPDGELIINCGRINYLAPEIFHDEPYNYPADIWSLGATVTHMLTGCPPFYGYKDILMIIKIAFDKKLDFTLSRPMSEKMQKLINDMTKPIPTQRTNAKNLLNYEFLKDSHIDYNTNGNNNQQITGISSRDTCIDLIQNALNNKKIGQVMGLICTNKCDHKFCLSSVIATNFKFGEYVGQGGFGLVYKMIDSNHKREFVMKTILVVDKNDENESKCFENNINNYQEKIIHPNIVKYFGVLRKSEQIFIFMEFIDGGTLRTRIAGNQYKPLPEETIKLYTKQILEGIKFLHASKIIHRDIKSDNILVTKDEIIKIADFGLSSFLRTISNYQKGTPQCGTPNYMAPEIIIGEEKYNHFADIWSVGATVLEMASGKPPCDGSNFFAILFKIGNEKKLEYPSNISNKMKTFLDLMIQGDPEERTDAETLLKCDFLNS